MGRVLTFEGLDVTLFASLGVFGQHIDKLIFARSAWENPLRNLRVDVWFLPSIR